MALIKLGLVICNRSRMAEVMEASSLARQPLTSADVVAGSFALVRCVEWARSSNGDASVSLWMLLTKVEEAVCKASDNDVSVQFVVPPVSGLLIRPVRGHRAEGVIESCARMAAKAVNSCGPGLARRIGVEGTMRLLGGVALRLTDGTEEARRWLLEMCRSLLSSRGRSTGEDRRAWDATWTALNEVSVGRPLIAALSKAAADVGIDESTSRQIRSSALRLLAECVEGTPREMAASLWRCFLPGLFGRTFAVAAKPSWAPRDGSLRADALDAATALVAVVLNEERDKRRQSTKGAALDRAIAAIASKARASRDKAPPQPPAPPKPNLGNEVRVDATEAWLEQTRQHLWAYLPAMLAACRRDPSPRTRLAAAEAAAKLYATEFFDAIHGGNFLVETLCALRFDDESAEVSRAASLALRDIVDAANSGRSLASAKRSAVKAAFAARSGEERALVDTLNMMQFAYTPPDAVDATLDALATIFEVEASARLAALEAPLAAPAFLGRSPDAAARIARATRLGAAFHRPNFKWLRLPRTRDAARRACWLFARDRGSAAVVIDRQLARLLPRGDDNETSSAAPPEAAEVIVLDELLQAITGRAFLHDLEEEPEDDNSAELVAVAECVARDALDALARVIPGDEPPVDMDEAATPQKYEYLRDGSALVVNSALPPSAAPPNISLAAPALCRVLALSCELATAAGGWRSTRPTLRRVLYPLLERLADHDAATRQAALGALVMIAALDDDDDNVAPDALAALLSRNMDYVVEAACRKMRRAKTAQAAARAAAVVEALLRHSRCSLATPLLRDVVNNALRDIDEHRLDGASHAHAFARLMRAMLNSLPETSGQDATNDDSMSSAESSQRHDWLSICFEAAAPATKSEDPVLRAFIHAHEEILKRKEEKKNGDGKAEHSIVDDEPQLGSTENERMYNRARQSAKERADGIDGTKEPTAEEDLVMRVLERAQYFLSPSFDLKTRRVALEIVASGVDRVRSNPTRVRPIVHSVWPAVTARLLATDVRDDSLSSFCLAAALDVVAAFARAVGDFMSHRFSDDLWPALKLILSAPLPKSQDAARAPRLRLLDSSLNCLFVFSEHQECAPFVSPIAVEAANLALDQLAKLQSFFSFDHLPTVLPRLLRSLAKHDADGLWLLVSTHLATKHAHSLPEIPDSWPKAPPLPGFPAWKFPSSHADPAPHPGPSNLSQLLFDVLRYLESTSTRFESVVLW